MNPYQILGIEATATGKEIKSAYRKMAMKWHPDKNKSDPESAKKMFQKIGDAYGILKDPRKKQMYDNYGIVNDQMPTSNGHSSGAHHGAHYGHSNPFKIFEEFMGSSGMGPNVSFSSFTNTSQTSVKQSRVPAPSSTHTLECDLETLVNGGTKKLAVTSVQKRRTVRNIIEIKIKPGWKHGTKITYQGYGDFNEHQHSKPGDVIVTIKEKKHATYFRNVNDLVRFHQISLKQAQTGFMLKLDHIDGKTLTRQVKPLKRTGKPIVFSKMGFPGKSKGDLLVYLDVILR